MWLSFLPLSRIADNFAHHQYFIFNRELVLQAERTIFICFLFVFVAGLYLVVTWNLKHNMVIWPVYLKLTDECRQLLRLLYDNHLFLFSHE